MENFIPYEKLSKKQKRALDAARRGSWGGLSPVTRRAENPKAYQRKKARIEEELDRAFFMTGGRGEAPAGRGPHPPQCDAEQCSALRGTFPVRGEGIERRPRAFGCFFLASPGRLW